MNSSILLVEELIEKLKYWGVYLMLLIIPISFSVSESRSYQETIFVMSTMTYASLYFGNVWITAFFALNMALFIYNGASIGSSQVMNIFMGCLLFTASRSIFRETSLVSIKHLMQVLVLLNIVFMALQILSIDPISIGRASYGPILWGQAFNLPVGLMHYQAALGMLLSLSIPFLITSGWLIPILLIIPVACTNSSVAYLSYAVSFLYGAFYIRMVIFKKKIYYWLLLASLITITLAGIVYDVQKDPLTGGSRFKNWHLYVRSAMSKPLFGFGPDSFRNETPHKKFIFFSDEDYNPLVIDYSNPEKPMARYHSPNEGDRIKFKDRVPKIYSMWTEAHNEYIQILFEYGLLGILLLGCFLFEVFSRFRISIENRDVRILFGAIICYLVFSITQFPFHLARIALFFPVILGAFFAKTDKDWDLFARGKNG